LFGLGQQACKFFILLCFFVFVFAELGFKLIAYTVNHSISPFL
jgi:hypothetical protein